MQQHDYLPAFKRMIEDAKGGDEVALNCIRNILKGVLHSIQNPQMVIELGETLADVWGRHEREEAELN